MADPSETTQISRKDARNEPTEEVFEALRELSTQVRSLQSEVRAIRVQTRSLPASGVEPPGWEDEEFRSRASFAWVRSLEGPTSRQPPVPRLLLEIVFLGAVAVAAAIAELDAKVIAAVMAGAWVLVALAEWAAARAERQRTEVVYAPLPQTGPAFVEDPSWFAPPVERTSLDVVEEADDTAADLPQASA
jgi:hypothetical protein